MTDSDRYARSLGGQVRGFSLVELLIVVAVIAILATTAWPSYMAYKVRANRGAAQTVMMDMANRQQQHFLDARAYTTSNAVLGHAALPAEVAPFYAIVVTTVAGPPPTYAITATPVFGSAQIDDGSLVLNGDGTRSGKW